MRHSEIVDALLAMSVPHRIVRHFPPLPYEVEGVLIYGSRARGDAIWDSDLDVLALVPRPRPNTHFREVNINYYTLNQLSTGVGTLFGAHLKRDAKIIQDKNGSLAGALQKMGEVDTERLLNRARNMSEIFTNLDRDLPAHLNGLLRQARYLLRSCYYAQAIIEGAPCFSVRELAARYNDDDLPRLVASRPEDEVSVEDLTQCLSRLRDLIGEFPQSKHGSLEAIVVNEWDNPCDSLSMAFLALAPGGVNGEYTEMEMILL